jgi:hypothetical protein
MNISPTEMPSSDLANPKPSGTGWGGQQLILVITLAFIAHVALVFFFGTKKPFLPQAVKNVPELSLASRADELVALSDPALFALPNPHDFGSAVWQKMPAIEQPSFRWTEAPRLLAPDAEHFGAAFHHFMRTNQFFELPPSFKSPAPFAIEFPAIDPALPQASTLQISGELAHRRLLVQPQLPSLLLNDVIAPSKVQVLVDRAGGVVSAVLLPAENTLESAGRTETGESNALASARSLRFAPSVQPTFGEIIFHWHTLTVTNAP